MRQFQQQLLQNLVCIHDFVKDMVNVIDQDGDGDINFNEFVWLMTRCIDEL